MWALFFLQISAETITEAGDPKETICEAVEKLKIELLVMGSHSRGALQRLLLTATIFNLMFSAKLLF